MATIQFKRGTAARWAELNLVLEAGQPGFVTDENRLKIGDGTTAWNDLPYIGEASVVNAQTHYDFPSIGRENTIYKAEAEKNIYQWNTALKRYELIGSTEISGDMSDIEIIHGGNAVVE
jgi:hypothetical protein